MSLTSFLRLGGAGLVVLASLHILFWRTLGWKQDLARVAPLTQRVFIVHAVVIAAMLFAVGMLSLLRPDLLIVPSELAQTLLVAMVVLWGARMLAQPIVFNPVMTQGWVSSQWVRHGATLVWLGYTAIYGAALIHQFGIDRSVVFAPLPMNTISTWFRVAVAAVWMIFGLVFKLLDAVPRHRQIAARVVGERWSRLVIVSVAIGEVVLGLWMLQGQNLVLCATSQTAAIVAMNALEITYARDLLLAPRFMLVANAVLLGLAWYAALS